MKAQELPLIAEHFGLSADAVSVGGSGFGECWAIEPIAEGWAVYYSERGDRVQEHRFGEERDACRYLLGWILDDAVRPWD